MAEREIRPVLYGRSTLSEDQIFQGGSKEKARPILFMVYFVRTESRMILVDAGCETMPGFVMEDFIGPVAALREMGIAPEDITDVVITHAHHDHIECVRRFPNALVHIQRDEYAAGKEYFSPEQRLSIFDETEEIESGLRVVRIGGHSIGSCVVEIDGEEQTVVLAGDECYQRECLLRKIPTGASFAPENSRAFIEKYSGDGYRVLLCHDR